MSARRWSRHLVCACLTLAVPAASHAASIDDLLHAYPDALSGFDGTNLIWRDGTRMPVSDGRPGKSIEQQLRNGSILDQLRLDYPAGAPVQPPGEDPGRVRNRAFFDRMYGDCKKGQVTPRLVPVVWLPSTWGHRVMVTAVNGVDRQLAAVSRELDTLPPEDKKFLFPAGTYACRSVADTAQASMHAWGAAIDINPKFADYWLWKAGRATGLSAYVNRIPPEIVQIFERHGFIWGGRWMHFDTMHFEYRPELFAPRLDP
jgi:hypothetical protein